MAIEIRAVPLDQLAPLRLRSFTCTPAPGDAASVEAAVRGLTSDELEELGAVVVAAFDGHLAVGIAVAQPLPRPGSWGIPLLAVRRAWQNQGLGRRLKDVCLGQVRAAGGIRAISSVHTETEAMHRINQSIPGAAWERDPEGPGTFYSIDLSG